MNTTVAFLGPRGTYSETAAFELFGRDAHYLPCDSFDAVVAAIKREAATDCVLPVENSIEGSVARVLDLLAGAPLAITAEVLLPIRHYLLGKAADLDGVHEVWAHPQALGQCRAWLTQNLPHAGQHAARSNAEAAQLAGKTPHATAIAGDAAAALYHLPVLAEDIADDPHNTTRFVAAGSTLPPGATHAGSNKTSLLCVVPNRAGSLHGLLGIFAGHGINLTKIESRPLPDRSWEYRFFIDCTGSASEPAMTRALAAAERYCTQYRLLGSYPFVVASPPPARAEPA